MTHKCEFAYATRGSTGSLVPNKCSRPQLRMCSICSKIIEVRCKATRYDVCTYCAKISKSRRGQQITEGLLPFKEHVEISGTARGVEKYPWDTQYCTHPKHERCEGPKGCRVSDSDAMEWNNALPEKFNDFITNLRREYPELGFEYEKVIEIKREMGHFHLVGVFNDFTPTFQTHEEKIKWHDEFIYFVQTELVRLGFGEQSSIKIKQGDITSSASYLTKYMTKSSELGITYSDETGEIRRGGYHVFTRSQRFGRTLQEIGEERNWLFLESLKNKTFKKTSEALARAVELHAQAVGAQEIDSAPNLDSSYKIIYADTT